MKVRVEDRMDKNDIKSERAKHENKLLEKFGRITLRRFYNLATSLVS